MDTAEHIAELERQVAALSDTAERWAVERNTAQDVARMAVAEAESLRKASDDYRAEVWRLRNLAREMLASSTERVAIRSSRRSTP